MTYDIMLIVTDRTTTLSQYTKFVVKTRPIFKNSLFVLHGNSDNTLKLGNIEVIGNKTEVRTDAYKAVFPNESNNPVANCVGLGYNSYLNFDRNTGALSESYSLCLFNRDGTAKIYNAFGLNEKFSYRSDYVLPDKQTTPFVYKQSVTTGDDSSDSYYQCILSRDGRFYVGKSFMSFFVPGKDAADDPLHQTDYKITAATIAERQYVLWDEKNNRFLYSSKINRYGYVEETVRDDQNTFIGNPVLDASVDFTELEKAGISPVGKQAVYAYIQYREDYESSSPLFLFKDKESNKFYLYELTSTEAGKDEKSISLLGDDNEGTDKPQAAYTITGKELTGFNPGSNLSSIMYNSWFSTNYLYYAEGGYVYRYNTSNGDRSTIYSAPDGYTISVMKFRATDSGGIKDDLGRYLSIGMNKGNEGAVAEILLTTAGDLDETVPTTFYTGFENIKDLQFAYIYYYKQLSNE